MFHHCNDPIRFGQFEHLELPHCCIVTWHLLAANSKLVENFEPSSEYSLWCWQQRKIVIEYSQVACEWVSAMTEIRLNGSSYRMSSKRAIHWRQMIVITLAIKIQYVIKKKKMLL